ncbi:MAG TPA: ABC transporter ATP-binding protein [Clostridiales bacterium]|nr:ABC transporter ATP-binding protein [Clostridiales bacterium]
MGEEMLAVKEKSIIRQAPIIVTDNLDRDFHSGREIVHALKKVNIKIEPEKLTILRGRSGSGKTTLINLLGGLDTPTKGRIFFKDKEITSMTVSKRDELRKKNFGFIFQSIAIISVMSAYENVEFGLRIAGFDSKHRRERAEECLTLVGLGKRMHHRAHELSGGEQQRVAIARAIAHRPGVIFADEPTAELDTYMGLQIVKLFKSLVEKEGLTVVMTTHDPSMMEIADCVYTLEDGEIVDEQWA